jgi:hypothetical protein
MFRSDGAIGIKEFREISEIKECFLLKLLNFPNFPFLIAPQEQGITNY